jgi:hypothetical protein
MNDTWSHAAARTFGHSSAHGSCPTTSRCCERLCVLRFSCHLSVRQLTVRSFRLILCCMVNYTQRLDRTCTAPVDPTRRPILTQLKRRDGASIIELAKP